MSTRGSEHVSRKSGRANKKKGASGASSAAASRGQPAEPASQPSNVRKAFQISGKAVGWVIAVASAITWVVFYTGPFWPAALNVAPVGVSAHDPFLVPFTIENPSTVFAAREVRFTCYIDRAFAARNAIMLGNVVRERPFTIPKSGVAQQVCRLPIDVIATHATIVIDVTRDNFWGFSKQVRAGPFEWHSELIPPKWLQENRYTE
jgi:hypothetical protein